MQCLVATVCAALLATAAAPAPTRSELEARALIPTMAPAAIAALTENYDALAKVLDGQPAEGAKKLDRAAFGKLLMSSGAAIDAEMCVAAVPPQSCRCCCHPAHTLLRCIPQCG